MEGVLKAFSATITGKKVTEEASESSKLLLDIKEIQRQIETAYNRFENENDSDLIEACVYELESLTARYRYLLRCAKELQVVCPQSELRANMKGAQKLMG